MLARLSGEPKVQTWVKLNQKKNPLSFGGGVEDRWVGQERVESETYFPCTNQRPRSSKIYPVDNMEHFSIAGEIGLPGAGSKQGRIVCSVPTPDWKCTISYTLSPLPCQCFGLISGVRGQVKINGQTVTHDPGRMDLVGTTVETGKRSRVDIVIPDKSIMARIGPNSLVDLTGLCQSGPVPIVLELVKGSLLEMLIKLGGAGRSFVVTGGNGGSGVRGELEPGKVRLASFGPHPGLLLAFTGRTVEPQERIYPDQKTIQQALRAFYMEYRPEQFLFLVEALKGVVRLQDAAGGQIQLKERGRFEKKWSAETPLNQIKKIDVMVGP